MSAVKPVHALLSFIYLDLETSSANVTSEDTHIVPDKGKVDIGCQTSTCPFVICLL